MTGVVLGKPKYKNACPKLEVLDSTALTLRSHDAGSAKTRAYICLVAPNWQEVSIEGSEWTALMEIMSDTFSDMDWLKMQQMEQARERTEKRRE